MKSKSIEVSVEQEDIDSGLRAQCKACPIAKAVLKHQRYKKVIVSNDFFVLDGARYILPPAAQDFIIAFDNYKSVKPFKFIAFATAEKVVQIPIFLQDPVSQL